MESRLRVEILPQPDDTTCGPTCLHAVYRYYEDLLPLEQVIRETARFDAGGTLAVMLAHHALARGYKATIHTWNLHVFDPSWFAARSKVDLAARLRAQAEVKHDPKLQIATDAYLEYLRLGGRFAWGDLTPRLLRRYLRRGVPILTGLSSTWLYQDPREVPPDDRPDDVLGVPGGHFVVLSGYDRPTRTVRIADPYEKNSIQPGDAHYAVPTERVVCAILLGVLTYDANFLVLEPRKKRPPSTK